MPIVMMHPAGQPSLGSTSNGPRSRLCMALVVLFFVNPPFGLIAVAFSISSRMAASHDYDGSRMKGEISFYISVIGIIVSFIAVFVFILIFYTRDT